MSITGATTACGPKEPPKSSPESMREAHDPNLLFQRGREFAKTNDLGRAQEYLVAAMDAGYDAKKVLPILLRVCVAAGNYHAAAEYGDRVLNTHPGDSRLRFVVATLYESTGDALKARSYMEQVAKEEPTDADVQFALGVLIRDDLKDLPMADQHFRAYLALAPNGPHADEARESMMLEVPKAGDTSNAPATSTTSTTGAPLPSSTPSTPAQAPAPAPAAPSFSPSTTSNTPTNAPTVPKQI